MAKAKMKRNETDVGAEFGEECGALGRGVKMSMSVDDETNCPTTEDTLVKLRTELEVLRATHGALCALLVSSSKVITWEGLERMSLAVVKSEVDTYEEKLSMCRGAPVKLRIEKPKPVKPKKEKEKVYPDARDLIENMRR